MIFLIRDKFYFAVLGVASATLFQLAHAAFSPCPRTSRTACPAWMFHWSHEVIPPARLDGPGLSRTLALMKLRQAHSAARAMKCTARATERQQTAQPLTHSRPLPRLFQCTVAAGCRVRSSCNRRGRLFEFAQKRGRRSFALGLASLLFSRFAWKFYLTSSFRARLGNLCFFRRPIHRAGGGDVRDFHSHI